MIMKKNKYELTEGFKLFMLFLLLSVVVTFLLLENNDRKQQLKNLESKTLELEKYVQETDKSLGDLQVRIDELDEKIPE